MSDALRFEGVEVAYRVRGRDLPALREVSLRIGPGEAYGLVGESGCGKSTAAYAAMGALPRGGRISAGRILADGEALDRIGAAALRRLRARRLSMVYQDPGRALNPSLTIGRQIEEVHALLGAGRSAARDDASAMLAQVRIADPARVMASYPHQLSGGMQQRVVIAMALAKRPALLVLDEPTTGLDATIATDILDLVDALRRDAGAAILLISHDLGIVGRLCDRVGVLYAGRLVEEGPTAALLADPRHPYTAMLLRCRPQGRRRDGALATIPGLPPALGDAPPGCVFAPRCPLAQPLCRDTAPPTRDFGGRFACCHFAERVPALADAPRPAVAPAVATGAEVLEARALSRTFSVGRRQVRALHAVGLSLAAGETLGLVGESGSGKSTLGRLLLGLDAPDPGGEVLLDGERLAPRVRGRTRGSIKALQIVFQNPDAALNRAHTVRRLIGRPLARLAGLRGAAREARLLALLDAVRLSPTHLPARPRQLSGGLKQRVAIARAFAGDPRIVVCDEPTSALDVSVQAAILNLLAELQAQSGTSYVFISHDLAVVRYLADRIAVLYRGQLVELGPAESVLSGPHHPYTEVLLGARAAGSWDADAPAGGCVFHPRCPRKIGAVCENEAPGFVPVEGHAIRCHLPRPELRRGAPPLDPARG